MAFSSLLTEAVDMSVFLRAKIKENSDDKMRLEASQSARLCLLGKNLTLNGVFTSMLCAAN